MGKAERERLNQTLSSHLSTIHETLQILDQPPASSLTKVNWEEVIKMSDQVSKQATIVGMLWTGTPKAKEVEENMATYFNALQGFLLLSHGSMVGAGPTLCSSMRASFKLVVDCSFKLMMETVPSYGSHVKDLKVRVPQLVGAVWEACSALKKTPATNVTAIGRAITQVAVSMKDVLREMNELKPESSEPANEAVKDAPDNGESRPDDDDVNSSDDDLGNDLSPEEMKVAQAAITVVTGTLAVIKELIRSITGLLKMEKPGDNGSFVDSLEKLLQLCQGIGVNIDELGACVYPPQEVSSIKASLANISSVISDVQKEVDSFQGSSDAFVQTCNALRTSMKQMESEVECLSTDDIESKLQSVCVSN